MKNSVPLSSLGLMVCLSAPVGIWVNLLDHASNNILGPVLFTLTVPPFGLCLMLGIFWGVLSRRYNWESATEKERTAFLQREQMSPDHKWKGRTSFIVAVLVVSGLTAPFIYGLHWLWKPPSISLPLFVGVTVILWLYATGAVLFWLNVCDRKLRTTRPPHTELPAPPQSSLKVQM